MLFRIAFLLNVCLFLCIAANAQGNLDALGSNDPLNAPKARFAGHSSSISGTVRTFLGQPVFDARVQIHDVQDGRIIATGYSNRGGAFEIMSVPTGSYEVVTTSGILESHDRVSVEGVDAEVGIRLPQSETSEAGGRDTVSVAEMMIPEKARKAFKKADSAARAQRPDEALKHVDEALAIDPKYADALTLRGILELDANQLPQASADLENSIQCDSNYSLAYFALGATYNMMSRFDDAIRTLDRGVGLAPTSWQGYFELGKAFLGKGNYEASLRQLNKTEDLQPKFASVHLVKAHALLGLKDYSNAMAELEVYLERDPKGMESAEARKTLDKVRAFAAANTH